MTTAIRPLAPDMSAGEVTIRYRYPGAPPFEDTDLDRRLFRGRADEADTVLHSILSTNLFLLYAESGLGKTSLLNAGVLHELRTRGHWPVSVRLNDVTRSPTDLVRAGIQDAALADPTVELVDNQPEAELRSSLWDLLSALEVWQGNDLQTPVVIFDQFEELFTLEWEDAVRRRFITEFGEVVRGHRDQPSDRREPMVPPPRVKFVVVVREDSLGELEALSADVPQIMRSRFRLGGLSLASADSAIREPGLLKDDRLDSRRFEYTEEAATEILTFLRASSRSSAGLTPTVDPSQLQIVCQYVERAIVPRKAADANPDAIVRIDAPDLGGKAGLDKILSAFYRRNLERFGGSQRRRVRRLCEKGLISPQERRLSLEESQIHNKYGVEVSMLQTLVDGRLLRAQPRLDSVSYELAHDTLVPAIRAERQRRRHRQWVAVAATIGCALLLTLGLAIVAVATGSSDSSARESDENSSPPIIIQSPAPTTVPRPLVPNVVGLRVDDAIAELEQLGMTAEILEVNSDRASGDVLSQNPAPVETAGEDAVVVLQVSIGRGVVLRDDFLVITPGRGETVDVLLNDDANGVTQELTPTLIEVDEGIVAEVINDGVVLVSADAPGTYEVSYGVGEVAPDERGTLVVTVEDLEAVILSAPNLAEVGAVVPFVGDSRGTIATRVWNFGDGETESGQRVEHIYDTAGSYEVTLSITDEMGNETSTSTTIDLVNPADTVEFDWPYGDVFEVPQRGPEPVRGSGCGGDGSIGDEIPDGTWYGLLSAIDRTGGSLTIDLVCVFFDDAAEEIIEKGMGSGPADFYVVNNSDRTRTVELHPEFTHHDAVRIDDGCVDPGPGADAASDVHELTPSWLIIADGQAVFALTSCAES